MKKIIAFVPIRFNNERLPNKNILDFGGQPLYRQVLDTLTKSKMINDIYVYCSDESIKKNLPNKVRFLKRDPSLDKNEVKGMQIYDRFVDEIDSDLYVLAHVTSPFLRAESIDDSLKKIIEENYDSALSVKKIQTFTWFKGKPLNYSLKDPPRTQLLEPIYAETSGFFIFTKKMIKNMRRIGNNPYFCIVDQVEAIDIDEKKDFDFAKLIYQRGKK